MSFRTRSSAGAALLCALVAAPAPAADTPLRQSLHLPRTDMAIAGMGGIAAPGPAGGGEGTLEVSGVGGEVTLALLYWNGIDIERPASGFTGGNGDYDQADIVFDGTPVTGERVAARGNNDGWDGSIDSAGTWRADVTALVQGDGSYPVTGLSEGGGHSTNGVSLIVYFDDGDAANDIEVVQFDGQISNLTLNHWREWFSIDYRGGPAELILHVSDGQTVHTHGQLRLDVAPGLLPSEVTQLRFDDPHDDGLPRFSGLSVPRMGFGRQNGGSGLWDIRRFALTPALHAPRAYDIELWYSGGTDALSLHVVQIVQPAGPQAPMLSPPAHDFGDVAVGDTSPTQRFTLANLMQYPIDVLALDPPGSRYPVIADACTGATLQPGESCTIDVACSPASDGYGSIADLTLAWERSGGVGREYDSRAALRCDGAPEVPSARMEVAPDARYFGVQYAGTRGAPQRFVATNTGSAPLVPAPARTIAPSAPRFFVTDDACAGVTLAPGQACHVDVAFEPRVDQDQTVRADLRMEFDSDAPIYPNRDIPLAGRAVPDAGAIFKDGFEQP